MERGKKRQIRFLMVVGGVMLSGAAPAQAFSLGFGAPIEERMGSEYGAEYAYRNSGFYYRGAEPSRRSGRSGAVCHSRTVKTRNGPRKVRRCR